MMAMPDPVFADPDMASISSAILWMQAVLLGRIATAISVIAVGAVGFGMLSGRLDMRRGMVTVIGCFVLFGASGIAAGLMAAAQFGQPSAADLQTAYSPQPPAAPIVRPNVAYDPYAGAAMPVQ
jgi:type IV secretory pathway VirB2 component (pilin)